MPTRPAASRRAAATVVAAPTSDVQNDAGAHRARRWNSLVIMTSDLSAQERRTSQNKTGEPAQPRTQTPKTSMMPVVGISVNQTAAGRGELFHRRGGRRGVGMNRRSRAMVLVLV